MPGADVFFDSNIILYLMSDDERKASISENILASGGCVSVQVLNEVTNVARRKYKIGWPEIDTLIQSLVANLAICTNDVDSHLHARRIAQRYDLHIYDAQIIASSLDAGCQTLYSEDKQHGQLFDGRLRLVNPFL
jgi:predicted nucleic acid-binding protein